MGHFALVLGEDIPIFIFAGQSIAINSGTDSGRLSQALQAAQTNVLFYNARATANAPTTTVHWAVYQPPTGPAYPSDSIYPDPQGTFGPEITTANLISKTFFRSDKIAVYKFAVGATSLHYFYNPVTPGQLYREMLVGLTNALATLPAETGYQGKIAGMFWTQGESDALDGVAFAAEYGSNLFQFVTSLREAFHQSRLPFVYGRITTAWPNAEGVRSGQESLTHLLKDVFMVDADDLVTATKHYDNEGTLELGNRYASAFQAILRHRLGLEIFFNQQWFVRAYGIPYDTYEIEYTDDLTRAGWTSLGSTQMGVQGLADFAISIGDRPQGFYRIKSR